MKILYSCLAATVVLTISGCGGSLGSDISTAAPVSAACSTASFPDTLGYQTLLKKYANDTQCLSQIQAAESYRQAAIANCSAGSTSGASGNYNYYLTSVKYVKGIGCT